VRERLQRYGTHSVQYEEGLAVARRIRASRYLGKILVGKHVYDINENLECSSKHNRGVTEVFYEAARVSLSTRAKGMDGGCIVV
jgi:Rho family protein